MIQVEGIFVGSGSDISAPIIGKDFNWTGGDGTYQVLEDGDGNWRIKFLSSGTFTPLRDMVIDAFLVGGGGSGGSGGSGSGGGGGGGGGGYTKTETSVVLGKGVNYTISVGAGGTNSDGGATIAFNLIANGGSAGTNGASDKAGNGGNGGSGGGGGANMMNVVGVGGSDGGDGGKGAASGGSGQGTTTKEFGESDGYIYANGGNGGNYTGDVGTEGDANTGNGGGGSGRGTSTHCAGGSGIVIIRKHKEAAA